MEYNQLPVEALQRALLRVDRVESRRVFEKCYEEHKRFEVLEYLVMNCLEIIGEGWEQGEYSLSQVYMSGVICEELILELIPRFEPRMKDQPCIGIGVLQDHHALGKRIVHSNLRASGYDIHDLGQGLTAEEMVKRAIELDVDYLLISTLMLSSAIKVKDVTALLGQEKKSVKVIVGGAPFRLDPSLWRQVYADADGKNGSTVVGLIEAMEAERGNHML